MDKIRHLSSLYTLFFIRFVIVMLTDDRISFKCSVSFWHRTRDSLVSDSYTRWLRG